MEEKTLSFGLLEKLETEIAVNLFIHNNLISGILNLLPFANVQNFGLRNEDTNKWNLRTVITYKFKDYESTYLIRTNDEFSSIIYNIEDEYPNFGVEEIEEHIEFDFFPRLKIKEKLLSEYFSPDSNNLVSRLYLNINQDNLGDKNYLIKKYLEFNRNVLEFKDLNLPSNINFSRIEDYN